MDIYQVKNTNKCRNRLHSSSKNPKSSKGKIFRLYLPSWEADHIIQWLFINYKIIIGAIGNQKAYECFSNRLIKQSFQTIDFKIRHKKLRQFRKKLDKLFLYRLASESKDYFSLEFSKKCGVLLDFFFTLQKLYNCPI